MSRGHILEQWPLNKECLNDKDNPRSPSFEQVACMHMPTSIFHPNAKTFNDFVDNGKEQEQLASAWRIYSSCFFALAEKASRVKGSKTYLCLEYVESKDDAKVPAGYTWWLFYSPPPPPAQNNDVAAPAAVGDDAAEQPQEHPREHKYLDWMAYNKVIGHFRNVERAAYEKGEEVRRPTNRTEAPWKCVPSFERWEDFVSLVLGWDYVHNDEAVNSLPSHCVTQFDFSPRTAFVMRGTKNVAEEQSLARMSAAMARLARQPSGLTYMPEAHVPSENTPRVNVCWPKPHLIYIVPSDLISHTQLYRKMLPHCQRDEANTACQLRILLPKLVRLCETGDDIDKDIVMSPAPVDNGEEGDTEDLDGRPDARDDLAALAMQAAHGNAAQRSNNKRQRLAQIEGAHRMMEGPARHFGTEALAIQKANATPYHPITDVMKSVMDIVLRSMQGNEVMARRIMFIIMMAGLREYMTKTAQTQGMSAPMRIIHRAIADQDLLRITPEIEEFFARPKVGEAVVVGDTSDGIAPDGSSGMNGQPTTTLVRARLSPIANYFCKLLLVLELVKHMNHLHKWFIIAMIGGTDSVRFSFGLHLHILFHTMRGGLGKSMIWALIKLFFIPGTIVEPQYDTAASGTAVEKVGEYNRSDEIVIEDEKSRKDMSSKVHDTSGKLERDKHEMTNGYSEVRGIMFDDEGNRILTTAFVTRSYVKLSSTNNPAIDEPLLSRYWAPLMPEAETGNRHIADTMNQEALDPREMKLVDNLVGRVHHFQHAVIAHIEKMVQSYLFLNISDDVCGIMAMALTQKLRKNQLYSEVNVRVFSRKRLVARQMCIRRNIIDLITVNGKVQADRITHLTPKVLLEKLQRRLFVTVEDYVMAAGLCAEDLLDPLEIGIRQCMKLIWDEAVSKTGTCLPSHFYEEAYEVDSSEDGPDIMKKGQRKLRKVTDYSYLAFNEENLMEQISARLPVVMMGFVSNLPAIRKKVHSFAERTVRSWGYKQKPRPIELTNGITTHRYHMENAPLEYGEESQQPAVMYNKKSGMIYVHVKFLKAVYNKDEREMDRIAAGQIAGARAANAEIDDELKMALPTGDGADSAASTSDTAGQRLVVEDKPDMSMSSSIIRDALQDILSKDGMCERELMFAPRQDEPKLMHSFKAGPSQRHGSAEESDLVVNKVTVADAQDILFFPELRKLVPAYKELQKSSVTFKKDLDTYALEEHNKRTGFLKDTAVSSNVLDELEEKLSTESDRYFAGVPVERVHPDQYEEFAEKNLGKIQQILQEPADEDEGDVDFDEKEFVYLRDGEQVNHWDRIAEDKVDAAPFGFPRGWGATSKERRHKYRQVCYHPALREHLYNELGV